MQPVRVPYPKKTDEIQVIETRQYIELGRGPSDTEERRLTLKQKVDEYLLKLGYSNAHVLGIVVQLMTRGKLRVEFRHYFERIALADVQDRISRAQAVTLFDDYVESIGKKNTSPLGMDVTHRIVVQAPRSPNA